MDAPGALTWQWAAIISGPNWRRAFRRCSFQPHIGRRCRRQLAGPDSMANTSSAKKAQRVIARRTEVNKSRRSRMRSYVGKVEDAIAAGDREKALAALKEAEPVLRRSAQKGIVHKNAASRKVSRLAGQVAKLGK